MRNNFAFFADQLEQAVERLDAAEDRIDACEPVHGEAQSLADAILGRIEFDLARTAAANALLGLTHAVMKSALPGGYQQQARLHQEAAHPGLRPLHRVVLEELEDREAIEALIAAAREADAAA